MARMTDETLEYLRAAVDDVPHSGTVRSCVEEIDALRADLVRLKGDLQTRDKQFTTDREMAARMHAKIARMQAVVFKCPLPPEAITWERGNELLNELQALAAAIAAESGGAVAPLAAQRSVSREPTPEMIHQAMLAAVQPENSGLEISIAAMWRAMWDRAA